MDYDFNKVEISSHYGGEMVHVFSDRDNKTGRRSVFLVREHSAYVCHMQGNPAVKTEFKTEEPRMVSKKEALWLVSALARAETFPEMGLSGENPRQLRRRVQDATFWVRYSQDQEDFLETLLRS